MKYVIRWKSNVNGRIGKGSRVFEKHEADTLAAELNAEYPEIEHEVAPVESAEPDALKNSEPEAEHALSECKLSGQWRAQE